LETQEVAAQGIFRSETASSKQGSPRCGAKASLQGRSVLVGTTHPLARRSFNLTLPSRIVKRVFYPVALC
jgi:hypothetical protein